VYTEEESEEASTDVTATSSEDVLTLTHETDIPAGSYWVTVTEQGKTESERLALTVEAYSETYNMGTVAGIKAFIQKSEGGTTVDNPIDVTLTSTFNLNNGDTNENWKALMAALNLTDVTKKYVTLNLSACQMDGSEFDAKTTSATNTVQKKWIVALVLPNAATSVKAGQSSASNFAGYSNLKRVEGANITEINDYAFTNITSLAEVGFPKLTEIGTAAFSGCTGLAEVSFLALTEIGTSAFNGCTSLTEVGFPELTKIGNMAFSGCTGLTEVSFPEVTEIGSTAFNNCSNLVTVRFPKVATVGTNAFQACKKLSSVYFPASPPTITTPFSNTGSGNTVNIYVPNNDAVNSYTTTWNVNASTSASTNANLYGTNHMTVKIVVKQE
jgi:hypothetical protein